MRILFTFILIFSISIFSQERPKISFEELLILTEENPYITQEAKQIASLTNKPHSIYTEDNKFIILLAAENNKLIYGVINDLLNPYNNGETIYYEELIHRFNIKTARVHYSDGTITNPELGYSTERSSNTSDFLMFLESTNDRIIAIDKETGNIIKLNFVPGGNINLDTPIVARLNYAFNITISDQLSDGVWAFDTTGNFISLFAPAGGVNTALMDNLRGHTYLPNGNVLVSVASGANANSIVQCDAQGNYIGQFITTGSGGLNSPYDILLRTNDIIVVTSSSDALHRYDLNGNFINNIWTSTSSSFFGQQMQQLENGDILLADFGVGGGLRLFSANGDSLNLWNVLTALRGCYKLGNGNFLVTNAAGLHEINPTTNTVVRTIVSGVAGRWISLFNPALIPVELISFTANISDNNIILNWSTASEKNNFGFEIQRISPQPPHSQGGGSPTLSDGGGWEIIGFVEGNGTSTEFNNYSFEDNNLFKGKYSYRLKQIDFDGSFQYSNIVEVEIGMPNEFFLLQNYPNPFNPSTNIEYVIASENGAKQSVQLKVYDILGNEVATLVNEFKDAGSYSVSFDAGKLSSGVYYYKLRAGEFISTKKMILIK